MIDSIFNFKISYHKVPLFLGCLFFCGQAKTDGEFIQKNWVVDSITVIHVPTAQINQTTGIMIELSKKFTSKFDFVKNVVLKNGVPINFTQKMVDVMLREWRVSIFINSDTLYCLYPSIQKYFKAKILNNEDNFYCKLKRGNNRDVEIYASYESNSLRMRYRQTEPLWYDDVELFFRQTGERDSLKHLFGNQKFTEHDDPSFIPKLTKKQIRDLKE